MKRTPTQFRAFRLPRVLDVSTRKKAKERGTTQTEIVVGILADAVKRGELPAPETVRDARQLDLL